MAIKNISCPATYHYATNLWHKKPDLIIFHKVAVIPIATSINTVCISIEILFYETDYKHTMFTCYTPKYLAM